MAKPLESASIAAPGFYGLNTQESSVTLAAGFALEANNCIIDKYGRLGSRKGWTLKSDAAYAGITFLGGHEFIDIDGTSTPLVWNATGIYDATDPVLPVLIANAGTAFTSANFDTATLNDKAFFCQRGEEPRYYDPTLNAGAGGVDDLSNAGATVSPPLANVCISAYGRLWLADTPTNKTTVYWSNLLDGTNFDSGTAGSIDLSSILVRGNDEIVSLSAHAGRLIVFCKRNIVIFSDNDSDSVLDPVTMQLVEVIRGTGCIARDSVQGTGNDVVFLSDSGVLSLGRLIQEKSQPMRDLSNNVRDDIVFLASNHASDTIRSIYSEKDAFYLLLFPDNNTIYCFDARSALQDGSSRVTTWSSQDQTNMYLVNKNLYYTVTDGIGQYGGYTDNGADYVMRYFTNYFDFDNSTAIKVLKRINATVIGGSNQTFALKVGYDYSDSYLSYPVRLDALDTYEYGIAEYGLSEYSIGTLVDQVRAPLGGNGNVIQMGLEATINGESLSIQRLDIYVKQGKVY